MPLMQGMSIHGMKRHPSLIPLFACLFGGTAAVVYFTGRAALTNPDVSWSNKKNPEPWQKYADKRYPLADPAKARGWIHILPRPKSIWD